MTLSELKPYMTHTNCFTRFVVARAIAKKNGEKHSSKHDKESGKILKLARASGEIHYIDHLRRSCYYDFSKPKAE